jgi:hypothetical protein
MTSTSWRCADRPNIAMNKSIASYASARKELLMSHSTKLCGEVCPFVLGVMGRGIIHGQLDPRTDTTKLTAGKLAAVVAHELPWYAIREDGSLENFNHRRDRLPLIQPTSDDRAGMIVKDGNQIALTAVLLAGVERTDIPRLYDVRRQSFKGVPAVSRAWNRWHRWSLLAQDTLHGIGGDAHALVVEKVGQSLRAEARVLCLRT